MSVKNKLVFGAAALPSLVLAASIIKPDATIVHQFGERAWIAQLALGCAVLAFVGLGIKQAVGRKEIP
jgi:hypothetical protein